MSKRNIKLMLLLISVTLILIVLSSAVPFLLFSFLSHASPTFWSKIIVLNLINSCLFSKHLFLFGDCHRSFLFNITDNNCYSPYPFCWALFCLVWCIATYCWYEDQKLWQCCFVSMKQPPRRNVETCQIYYILTFNFYNIS